jgi:excisionase family DNA binding protein
MSEIVPDADLLTVPEAATVLKVSPVTVSRWLRQGRLPAYRLGPRAVRIRRADLAAVFSPARERTGGTPARSEPTSDPALGPSEGAAVVAAPAWAVRGLDADAVEARLAALAVAGALREQILARRKGANVPPLDGDRKRGKRS